MTPSKTKVCCLLIQLLMIQIDSVKLQCDWNELSDQLENSHIILPSDPIFLATSKNMFTIYDDIIPSSIIQINSETDVIPTINFLVSNKIKFTVKSGGHSYGGYNKCIGCSMINLSNMNNISFINNNYLTVHPSVTQYKYVQWMKNNYPNINIMLPIGDIGSVAFGGYSQSGGLSIISRQFGLMIDYIIGIHIVLSNGKLLKLIDEEYKNDFDTYDYKSHKELLWAVRGSGGGNFGIVTQFILAPIIHIDKTNINFFTLIYTITTRDDIYTFLETYYWFLSNQNEALTDSMSVTMTIEPSFDIDIPFGYQMKIIGFYIGENKNGLTIMMDCIKHKMQNVNIWNEYIIVDKTLNDIMYDIYGSLPMDEINGYMISTLIEIEQQYNTVIRSIITDKLYEQIVMKPLYRNNIVVLYYQGGMRGIISLKDKNFKKTSFQSRDVFGEILMNIMFLEQDVKQKAYDIGKWYQMNVLFEISYRKYIGDVENHFNLTQCSLTQYYPNELIFDRLRTIKSKYDPNNEFKFEFSIPPK
eukprot:274602_1